MSTSTSGAFSEATYSNRSMRTFCAVAGPTFCAHACMHVPGVVNEHEQKNGRRRVRVFIRIPKRFLSDAYAAVGTVKSSHGGSRGWSKFFPSEAISSFWPIELSPKLSSDSLV